MTKDEILKKAQMERPNLPDEMEQDIMQKSSHWGMIVGIIVCLILMVIKMYLNLPYHDLFAVYSSVFCGQYVYKWIRQRDKFPLVCGVFWGASAAINLLTYFSEIL